MNKLFTALLVGGCVLAGSSSMTAAQTSPDATRQFSTLLAEARSKTPVSTETATINTHLSSAEWYWNHGNQAQAISYLNFARGRLGLPIIPPVTQTAEQWKP